MADNTRVYSDEEFALILRKATEMANGVETGSTVGSGLTMSEMKAAAAQVGFDPALVERAARNLALTTTESPLERFIGGPIRHNHSTRFSVQLTNEQAAQLLSVVRVHAALAGHQDVGHASELGLTWHDGGDLESLSVTAHPDRDGTTVSIALDRRGPLSVVAMVSGMALFLSVLFSVFALYPESPALGVVGLIAGFGGVLGGVRSVWAASTRRVRERIDGIMDTVAGVLARPESRNTTTALPRRAGHPDPSSDADTGAENA